MPHAITRRDFFQSLGMTAAGVFACNSNVKPADSPDLAYATLRSRPAKPTQRAKTGLQRLGLGAQRDGFLYVPPTYSPGSATPMLVLLHGAGRDSSGWSSVVASKVFDNSPIIVMAPESRGPTWDLRLGGYGQDVSFINDALDLAFHMCNVDAAHLGIGGFSDGASYALSLGITNGDLFTALIGFSPGFIKPATKRGKPKIFIAHGRQDEILPIDRTSRVFVPALRKDGYNVTYDEFDGGHEVNRDELSGAVRWFTQP
jgi:predicted esterase